MEDSYDSRLDEVDARKSGRSGNSGDGDEILLTTLIDADEYNMDHAKRGTLLLFNHKTFDPRLNMKERSGTDRDRDRLKTLFAKMGFDVKVYEDLSFMKLQEQVEKAAKSDHTQSDCFACIVLSHGDEGFLYSHDNKYKPSELWKPFLGKECPTLVGKPKLFFIQACQGSQVDDGVDVKARKYETDTLQVMKIPIHSDFLIAYSTVPGYYSWRNTTDGSWFAQSLCDIFSAHHNNEDLLSMLTRVNRAVAYKFESNTPGCWDMHRKKQIPYFSSMLTRKVFLRSK